MKAPATLKRKVAVIPLFVVLCVLLPAELTLRVSEAYLTHPEKTIGRYDSYFGTVRDSWLWVWAPGIEVSQQNAEFVYQVSTNSHGIRDQEHEVGKPPGRFRIVTMGDSYTEGVGADFEETWFRVLQRSMQKRGHDVEVISGGVGGSDVFYDYQLFVQKLLRYDPDLVILPFNNSDLSDIFFRGGAERFHDDGNAHFKEGPWFEPLYQHSHIARFVVHGIVGYDWQFLRPDEIGPSNRESEARLLEGIDRFARSSEEHDFELAVVYYVAPEMLADGRTPFSEEFLAALRRKPHGLVDLTKPLGDRITHDNLPEYSWSLDGHFNGKGYALFADVLESELERRGLLPASRAAP